MDDLAPDDLMPSSPGTVRRGPLLAAAVLALLALAVSAYLSVQSLSGQAVAGCGGASGCGAVLASPWAKVGAVPVSVLGLAVYLMVLLALGLGLISGGRSRLAEGLLVAAVPVLVGAAGWFVYVQVAKLGQWCPFCMAGHGLGVLLAATLVLTLRGRRAMNPAGPVVVGILGVAMLAVVQTVAPATPLPHGASNPHADRDYDRTLATGQRELGLFGGALQLTLPETPYRGDPAAPQTLALVFDYSCRHCRDMRQRLEQVQRERGDFVLILLPVSIAPEHNPYIEDLASQFMDSYELAVLSLAVHAIDHEAWLAFDRWLLETDTYRTADEARAEAVELVGKPAFETQLAGPAGDRHREAVDRNIELLGLIPEDRRRIPVTAAPGASRYLTERVYQDQPILDLLDRAAAGLTRE